MYYKIADFIWKFIHIEDEEEWKQIDELVRLCLHALITTSLIVLVSYTFGFVYESILSIVLYNSVKQLMNIDLYDSDSLERCMIISTIIFCGIGKLSSTLSQDLLTSLSISGILTIWFICISTTNIGKNILKFMDNLLTIDK